MLNDPLYRTAAILLVLLAYGLIRQSMLDEPKEEAQEIPSAATNMANLKQYRLGAYRFEIPAPFVLHVAAGLGKTENIVTGFTYPALEPIALGERNRAGLGDEVKATLHPKATCAGIDTTCNDYPFQQYKRRLFGDASAVVQEIPQIAMTEQGEFGRFDITYKEEPYFMYVKGEPQLPLEWYYCKDKGDKSYCVTFYPLEENLVVELTFDADLLPEHAALRAKIDQTLRKFIYYKQEK